MAASQTVLGHTFGLQTVFRYTTEATMDSAPVILHMITNTSFLALKCVVHAYLKEDVMSLSAATTSNSPL